MTNEADLGTLSELRVLLFQQDGIWVAQALEVNLVAQAKEFRDVLYELERVIAGRMFQARQLGVAPFAGIKAAPKKYWDLYESAALDASPRSPVEFDVAENRPKLQLRTAA
ncbi:MAG: hypothetical protein SX243_00785 [Acidobacteriota bacterium]|nr:hypothetical protein [Acidobacteriota bacterium]